MQNSPNNAQSTLIKIHTQKDSGSNSSRLFGFRAFIALAFCLLMTIFMLVFSGTAIQAKGVSKLNYQGLILQVDRTNSNDVTFSLLDHHGTTSTFHLMTSTQFKHNQSASQLAVNLLATVRAEAGTTGTLNAKSVQIQEHNKATFELQGVVASIDQNANSIMLALSDGTMLTIAMPHTNIATLQTGATIALKAIFTNTGLLVASKYHIVAPHASHFHARGIVSHVNVRVHLLTLVSPVGASFSVLQGKINAFVIGEKVDISGSSDNKGNLRVESASVENNNNQYLTVIGMISVINATAGTFSLVDKQGNSSTVNASSDLMASLQVGGVYQLEISIASDGSMTVSKVLSSQGSDQGNTISLQGTVQFYDASSGLLNMSTDNGQSFSLQANNQTTIVNSDGTQGTLASGQAIHALVQLLTDGTYTVLKIEIQDPASAGNQMTFVGFFLYYDNASGNLIINPGYHHRLRFNTNSSTQIDGASSLDSINSWSIVNVTAQVQADGSYLATLVQVTSDNQDN